ncbi:MAG TPA: hypothetical protein VLL52_19815 [Anaerolineae bacterium]|nr:hypothetical protein [Anaerolineae bacterium]
MTFINKTSLRLVIVLTVIALTSLFFWNTRHTQPQWTPSVAAKGRAMPRPMSAELGAHELLARDIALGNANFATQTRDHQLDFLYSHPLSPGEAARWPQCQPYQCTLVSFYNYTQGGVTTAVVDLIQKQTLNVAHDPAARPAPSLRLLPKMLSLASQDERVTAALGDIRQHPAVMPAMSVWLNDDDCNQAWCIDLTFPAPGREGRILHVILNMHDETVTRLFETRGRARRTPLPASTTDTAAKPNEQGDGSLYANGCREQYGWSVCWEMTAHDGLEFRDATFNDKTIFSSAKISQVEVFYAAWPGGYRDEIGYDASVPPKDGTNIVELEDGFEVSQLFTEPFDWPNCICCYRYEQIIRFFADGTFEFRFVSHGPGCDDLSSYRPFWRVDLDLDNKRDDEAWYWDQNRWVEAENEVELDLYGETNPDGQRLATFDGDLHYRWYPIKTDPLGVDDGRLFLTRWRDTEGTGPIFPGPADTFRPPRQWLNNEELSGNDSVIWFIPLLATKKTEPWWCMPDPDPDYSPCEAILRVEPDTELPPFDPDAIAAITPTPQVDPTPTRPPAPTPTPRPIPGDTAPGIILNGGCGTCHLIGTIGEAGKVGPDLSDIGRVAAERIDGLSAAEYIRIGILNPNEHLAPDCPNGPCQANVMPRDYGQRLTANQVDILVDFLLTQTGAESPDPIGTDNDDSDDNDSDDDPSANETDQPPGIASLPTPPIPFLYEGTLLLLGLFLGLIISRQLQKPK